MDIQVGQLEVIVYIPIQCSKHGWALSVRSVLECPYYICLKTGDRSVYDAYMDLWSKRDPKVKAGRTYDHFLEQVDGLRNDGGYRTDKAEKNPMRIYRGTRWLRDGHHRAAIFCALYGHEMVVPVQEVDCALPDDLNLCANPCKD